MGIDLNSGAYIHIGGELGRFNSLPIDVLINVNKEDNYFVVQSELLGLIGTGLTEDEAKESFCEDFTYLFNKLNALPNSQLTQHNVFVKELFNNLVHQP